MTALDHPTGSDFTAKGRDGASLPMRLIAQDVTAERQITVMVSPDGMHAYAKVTRNEGFTQLRREDLISVVARAGIVLGLVDDGIKLFVHLVNTDTSGGYKEFFEVARGIPPQKGENGSIEFHVQPTSMEPRYDQNDEGGIDFKQLNLIENCFAGQRVASILPPGPGRGGRDVFGMDIAPTPGEPVNIISGPGIALSANGRDFTTEIEGRLVYEDGQLSVSPLLEISRDIDYSVGNVDFVGKVIIRGSLPDGFYVNAKQGVELYGDMGAARITSEGDVKITGGIKGKNAAMITCRNLSTHYIDDASVEAIGDVTATKEIMNSSVKALGSVSVATGAIIGGLVCGFRGVEADTLGSDMGVATRVLAGLNWTEENRKDEIRHQLAEYTERIQASQMILERVFEDHEITARLGVEQKIMFEDITSELRDIRELMQDLLEERARIDSRQQIGMVNQINVRKMLYMGVTARFSRVDTQVKDSIRGPVSLIQDTTRKIMATQALTPLPKAPTPGENVGGEE